MIESGSAIAPIVLLVAVLASDAWVAWDAARRHDRGDDVVASIGPLTLDRPEVWLMACLVLWIVAFPAYLVARRGSS